MSIGLPVRRFVETWPILGFSETVAMGRFTKIVYRVVAYNNPPPAAYYLTSGSPLPSKPYVMFSHSWIASGVKHQCDCYIMYTLGTIIAVCSSLGGRWLGCDIK